MQMPRHCASHGAVTQFPSRELPSRNAVPEVRTTVLLATIPNQPGSGLSISIHVITGTPAVACLPIIVFIFGVGNSPATWQLACNRGGSLTSRQVRDRSSTLGNTCSHQAFPAARCLAKANLQTHVMGSTVPQDFPCAEI